MTASSHYRNMVPWNPDVFVTESNQRVPLGSLANAIDYECG